MKVNLRADDTRISVDLGTVYTEKRTFKDFIVSKYKSSDGIKVKNQVLSDGRRMAEWYDAVKRKYRCSIFDENGTLLSRESADSTRKYTIEKRMTDGTMSEKSCCLLFMRGFDGNMCDCKLVTRRISHNCFSLNYNIR